MKRLFLSRDGLLLLGLFILVAGFSAFVALRQREIQAQQAITVSHSTHSAQADGTLALYQWLGELGHRVERIENRSFEITDGTRLLFVLAPTVTIEADEAEYILQWVARGNTLIVADDRGFRQNAIFNELQADTDFSGDRVARAPLSQPLLDGTTGEFELGTRGELELDDANFVPYVQGDANPILARVPHGSGVVWLSTSPDLFTNENLGNENNAKLTRALLAGVPPGGLIAFDEYHLGFVPEVTASFLQVLYDVPWGWAVWFTIILVFFYLALNGQRFGRVLPIPKSLARRSPSEYVTSMANLFRRANKRGMVLQHYRHSLKRRLGRPYHLNPELSDERYIEMLARLRPELDRAELTNLLSSLRRTDTTEADLVKTISQSVTFGSRPTN